MKKTIPFMISVLAIASMVSIGVLGNAQTAYAGSPPITSCTITPDMVNVQLGPNESVEIPKTIECDGFLTEFDFFDNCVFNTVFIGSTNFQGTTATFTETILNVGDISEEHCTVDFIVVDEFQNEVILIQEIWINEQEEIVVGGDFLPIDSTSLLLAGAQSFYWMIPVVLSVLGIGLFVATRKSE